MSETLESKPRRFSVRRHVNGKHAETLVTREYAWVCSGKMCGADMAQKVALACRILTGKAKGQTTTAEESYVAQTKVGAGRQPQTKYQIVVEVHE